MEFLLAAVLGLIQGLTEFLPVSSSGHLVILERLAGIRVPALTFHVFLHAGTMLAAISYMNREVKELLREGADLIGGTAGSAASLLGRGDHAFTRQRTHISNQSKLLQQVMTVTAASVLTGALLTGAASCASGSMLAAGIGFLVTGILLIVSDMVRPGANTARDLTTRQCVVLGIVQGISVLPGLSRTGLTVSTAVFSGLGKKAALRLSCLISIPVTAAALVYVICDGIGAGIFNLNFLGICLAGTAVSAAAGRLTMGMVMGRLRKAAFRPFACYSFAAGFMAVLLSFL